METKPQNLQNKISKHMGCNKTSAQREIYSKRAPICKKDLRSKNNLNIHLRKLGK